jgi:hypothetical protein
MRRKELELELVQTQVEQKLMLPEEVYARALRASRNVKRTEVWVRSKEIKVATCILWSEMSQDGDDTNPLDRGNPGFLRLCLFLFDLDSNEALDHYKNPSIPGSNEPKKCICSRLMRSQQHRTYAVAMRARGAGNQLQWGEVLPAALRAAWNYSEYDKQASCPPLPSADIAAWEREPDPTMESAKLFITVLGGVFACFCLLDLPAPFGRPRRHS